MFNLVKKDYFDSFPDMNDIFEDFFNGFDRIHTTRTPLNAYQTDTEVSIELYAPNIDSENINISIEDGILKIEGNVSRNNETQDKQYYRREFVNKSFVRSVMIPAEVKEDETKAEYKDGILRITLPKKEKKKTTKIKVESK